MVNIANQTKRMQTSSFRDSRAGAGIRGGAREQQRGVRHFIAYIWYSSKHDKKLKMIRNCNFFLGAAAPTPHYVAPPLLMKLSPSQVPTVAHNLV